MKHLFLKLLFCFLFFTPLLNYAHAPEQGYIFLRVYEKDGIEGRFDVLADDFKKIFNWNLPSKGNDKEDFLPYLDRIHEYLIAKSGFSSSLGVHHVTFNDLGVFNSSLGDYVQVYFKLDNFETLPDTIDVEYNLIFDQTPIHQGFTIIEYNWKAGVINDEFNIQASYTNSQRKDTISLTETSVWKGFVAMVKQGVWHIWIGIDHIFFLIALILPAVVTRFRDKKTPIFKRWKAVPRFKPAFLYIVKIVTFFTIAHTITLSLAALEIIVLPSWFVETTIAFSIGLAAFHNIIPIFKGRDWVIAFIFGLFHGFGFASVLGDIGLKDDFLTYTLLGFNVGVEIGQLVIILAIFPILYLIRKLKLYPKFLVFTSGFLILASIYWMIERIFDVNLGVEDVIKQALIQIALALGLL